MLAALPRPGWITGGRRFDEIVMWTKTRWWNSNAAERTSIGKEGEGNAGANLRWEYERSHDFFRGGVTFFLEKLTTAFSRHPQNTRLLQKHFTTFPGGMWPPCPCLRAPMGGRKGMNAGNVWEREEGRVRRLFTAATDYNVLMKVMMMMMMMRIRARFRSMSSCLCTSMRWILRKFTVHHRTWATTIAGEQVEIKKTNRQFIESINLVKKSARVQAIDTTKSRALDVYRGRCSRRDWRWLHCSPSQQHLQV